MGMFDRTRPANHKCIGVRDARGEERMRRKQFKFGQRQLERHQFRLPIVIAQFMPASPSSAPFPLSLLPPSSSFF